MYCKEVYKNIRAPLCLPITFPDVLLFGKMIIKLVYKVVFKPLEKIFVENKNVG